MGDNILYELEKRGVHRESWLATKVKECRSRSALKDKMCYSRGLLSADATGKQVFNVFALCYDFTVIA